MKKLICLVGLICFFQSESSGQDIHSKYLEINKAALSEEKKIDSLYQFYLRNYFVDYATVDSLASQTLKQAQKLKYKRGEGVTQIVLALVNEGMGRLDLMEKYSKAALIILEQNKLEQDLARAYFARGTYYRRKNLKADALSSFISGLRITEKTKDSTSMRMAYTYIAILNVSEKNYKKALEYHLKALDIARKIKDLNSEQKCYTNIGIVYSREKDYNQALKYHQLALKLALELKDPQTIAFVYNDLGSTYLYLNSYSRAIDYLKRSISIRESGNELSELAYTYNYLGQAYAKSNQFSKSEVALKKSHAIAKQIGNSKQIYEAFEELSNMYAHFKRFDSAYVYSHKYTLYRDSIRQIENTEALNQLGAEFETEKKEQQIKDLSQQNTIQELELEQRNFWLVIAAVLLVLATLLTYIIAYKRKQREKQLALEAQLLRVEAEQKLNNERVRISKDLHDNIGSYLTFINTSMAGVNSVNPEEKDKLNKIKDLTLETIQELRKTVWLINKSDVSVEEFSVKLRELFKNIGFLKVKVERGDQLKISAPIATEIFRVVQESVNNALKHSMATQINVTLNVEEGGMLQMCIEDNGEGFDKDKVIKGFGLYNMQERIEQIEGNIKIDSEQGKGTSICIEVPLSKI